MRMRHEEVRRENFGDHSSRDRQRGQASAASAAFVLQGVSVVQRPGIR